MKRPFTFLLALLCSLTALAQWTQPSQPAFQTLTADEAVYLFNADANAFYLGANDWSTRASVNATRGYKVTITQSTVSDTWDGESYFIMSAIEDGNPAGKTLPTFITSWDNIWVDCTSDKQDRSWTFTAQGDGTYKIGLSSLNTEMKPDAFEDGACLGVIPEKNDTRVYLCEPGTGSYEFSGCQVRWAFVTESDYTAYVAAVKAYDAAQLLAADIAEAKENFPSVDISSVESVYNNTSSTADELEAAREELVTLLANAATADNAADVTLKYFTNPNYDDNDNTGWSGTAPGFQTYQNAEYYWKSYNVYQSFTLPEGVYRVSLDGFYRAGWADKDAEALTALNNGEEAPQNALLYATSSLLSDYTTPLPFCSTGASEESLHSDVLSNSFGYIPNSMAGAAAYVSAGQYARTALLAMVGEDGALTVGLKKETTPDGDWTIFDTWKLEYLGSGDDAYQAMRDDYLANATDYVALVDDGTAAYYDHSAYETASAAKTALAAATAKDAIVSAIGEFDTANTALGESIDAYEAYYEKYQEAQTFLDEKEESLMGEDFELLADYVQSDEAPSETFSNGGAVYILENGNLDAEGIAAETEYLQTLMDNALANGMSDGADCTDLIKNPHFTEEGIWSQSTFATWPKGTDDYKLAEAYGILFDVYQDITGLQEGLYELTLNGFYRPANYGGDGYDSSNKAYVYMNDDQVEMPFIENEPVSEMAYSDDYQLDAGYVPNSVSGAATAFQAGRYAITLYGIVTDGTLRIGARNDVRFEGSWGVWSDFKLTFRAKNEEVLETVTNSTIAAAEKLLNNKCGNEELNALKDAISAAQSNPEDAYQALLDLKAAIADVDTSTTNYATLAEALATANETLTNYADSTGVDLTELQSLTDEAQAAYDAGTYNKTEAEDKANELNAAVTSVKMGDTSGEKDVTELIVNPTFDPDRGSKADGTIEGWTTTAMNGYKQNTVSYNKSGFHLYQTLYGLPAGHYKVTVYTYYRAGYYNEEWERKENGEETHLTTLYATTPDETFSMKVKNLYEDTSDSDLGAKCYTMPDGTYAPDGTTPTVTFFNNGYYLNELEFDVTEDGSDVTIGLKKDEVLANDYEVVGAWNLYYYPVTETDVTELIVNPTFDPDRGSKADGTIEGWTTTAMNGYKQNTVSYNKSGFHLWQTLYGLPAGDYKVTVYTYYRAGYYNEEWERKENGEETHLTTFYAATPDSTYSTLVKNLYEDTSDSDLGAKCYTMPDGTYAPDGTTPTVTFFNNGYYLNELYFTVSEDDSDVTIGLKKDEVLANDYEVVGAWNLYYYGVSSAIDQVIANRNAQTGSSASVVGYYTLSGMRLSAPQKGINIVKMSDGTALKVLVK